jgi:hypothetical protein
MKISDHPNWSRKVLTATQMRVNCIATKKKKKDGPESGRNLMREQREEPDNGNAADRRWARVATWEK